MMAVIYHINLEKEKLHPPEYVARAAGVHGMGTARLVRCVNYARSVQKKQNQ